MCFHNVINHEIYQFFFSYLIHVQYIIPNCKFGPIDDIEQNVEVQMQYVYYFIDKSINNET
jgi:hypothetical protein